MTAQPTPTGPDFAGFVATAVAFGEAMREAAIPASRKMAAFVKATQEANRKAQVQP